MRGQRHASAAFTPKKDPVSIVKEAGWAPGPVWTGAESLVHTGIRFPDRPARSQWLYRLSYPAHVVAEGLIEDINIFTKKNFPGSHTIRYSVFQLTMSPEIFIAEHGVNADIYLVVIYNPKVFGADFPGVHPID